MKSLLVLKLGFFDTVHQISRLVLQTFPKRLLATSSVRVGIEMQTRHGSATEELIILYVNVD